ncbi:hypothetical protein FF38_02321 [Lucilia cuprina]|uniref:Uncharacterized protein n=1 Tax=Lucilia cuprina TaxID=7375 RepID=A0A0L0C6G1_LUCCU|nr:hypothetical protein FF38_02321 [Lucilia cuprina]
MYQQIGLYNYYSLSFHVYVVFSLHIIALSTLAVPHGKVIDMGYSETTVMPVYSGVQITQAF